MDFRRHVLIVLVLFVCLVVVQNQAASASNDDSDVDINKRDSTKKSTTETVKPEVSKDNSTSNGTDPNDDGFFGTIVENKDMLLRTLYVLIGVTSVVILYFVFRAWRIRGRRSKSRKYGLITTRGSDLEMAPLDADDEDEDMTVFEMNDRHK
ncbi:membrane protein FAM174-like [Mizuhopecten yessoensis]|uniref:Membrane protein C19orf24 n=1 Tax=Mizuhopecten yessoensis TaxID=6573 RepID=A0A210PYR5_MIZYE|nr:membrane protein FAM174-like [Mizuhopecten yessoensis]OWF41622.1 membrane protein C19orf24 [Mizuhopecten yessoensis]